MAIKTKMVKGGKATLGAIRPYEALFSEEGNRIYLKVDEKHFLSIPITEIGPPVYAGDTNLATKNTYDRVPAGTEITFIVE